MPDITVPEVSQHSRMEARAVAVEETMEDQRRNETLNKAKAAIETGRGWDKELQEQSPANIKAMMTLIEPALKGKDAAGTKNRRYITGMHSSQHTAWTERATEALWLTKGKSGLSGSKKRCRCSQDLLDM